MKKRLPQMYCRFFILTILCVLSANSLAVDTSAAFVRISLLGEGHEFLQGQERQLSVKLYTETWLRKAPRYPEITVDGALVVRPLSFATHGQETIEARDYIVQEQIYRIYPQRLGAFYVAPIQLSMSLARSGRAVQPLILHSNDLIFTVTEKRDDLVADEGQLQEEYRLIAGERSTVLSPGDTWSLEPGDVVERKIRLTAKQTTAVLLPAFTQLFSESYRNAPFFDEAQFSQQDVTGGKVFRRVSQLDDRENRGEFLAIREEIWRYEFNQPGDFTIPALALSYWDSSDGAQQMLALPEQKIKRVGVFSRASVVWLGMSILLVLIGWWCFNRLGIGRCLASVWRQNLRKRANPEREAWQALCASIREAGGSKVYQRFHQWWRFWKMGPEGFDALVTHRYDLLPKYLSTPYSPDNSAGKMAALSAIEQRQLINELQELRDCLKGARNPIATDKNLCLPPLNPPPKV
ncbi:BatD family protein [Pseudoteredinibacter isoporae]|uniref:Oxygen tolerance protein BatD n=1 Tax=Pseudoteredinibacter isoporae TaxID=570281 RepID=A0A7X0JR24_9GAMM|nr:BatD family protein [Pseudoteredinibacter isoporae]MBB6520700.1 hypothetical protein [Pseudoteredinibacter isoporae]NHO86267.1 protein BatD [Pseudoteredinibacter isoporae]NIB25282.1 protein BatD [Pseudoteredinibacter isoporae]